MKRNDKSVAHVLLHFLDAAERSVLLFCSPSQVMKMRFMIDWWWSAHCRRPTPSSFHRASINRISPPTVAGNYTQNRNQRLTVSCSLSTRKFLLSIFGLFAHFWKAAGVFNWSIRLTIYLHIQIKSVSMTCFVIWRSVSTTFGLCNSIISVNSLK